MGTSEVTGRPEPQYNAWRRRVWRHCVSFPLTLFCLSLASVATFAFLRAQVNTSQIVVNLKGFTYNIQRRYESVFI